MLRALAVRTVLAAAAGACVLPLTGCSQAQRTADCITFAGRISNDVAALKDVVTDPAQTATDLQKLQEDLADAGSNLDSQDARNAVNALSATTTKLTAKVQSGQGATIDDLDPMFSEAWDLTKACKS